MKELFEGKEVEIPIFNFLTGYREKSGSKVKMPKNGIFTRVLKGGKVKVGDKCELVDTGKKILSL